MSVTLIGAAVGAASGALAGRLTDIGVNDDFMRDTARALPPGGLLSDSQEAQRETLARHDGLADFADGIGGGRDRAHRLEIMRDSRIGSFGTLALILSILARLIARRTQVDEVLWQAAQKP